MKIKRGDTVKVIAGKDKGKVGKVVQAMPTEQRVIVEGVNMVTKHKKASQKVNQGGIIHQEAPIHVSNLMILDPKEKTGSRVGVKVTYVEKNGKQKRVALRYAKKSGTMLD